jgi:hypothetical protein
MRKPFDGDYPITQTFGNKLILGGKDYYSQWGLQGHNGIDYGTPTGTIIKAPHDGTVVEASYDANGLGNYIKIESDKYGSVLAHLETMKVNVGFQVKEGEEIGTSDNTGYSTGAHLHWGWYQLPRNRGNGFNGYMDQQQVLDSLPAQASGKLYTEAEYQAAMNDRQKFWNERDEVIGKLNTALGDITALQGKLSAFGALGYNSVDDVTKALGTKDTTIQGLNTQLVQVLQRNETLAQLVASKENEDSTAISDGAKAVKELVKLQEHLKQIISASGVDPESDILDILDHVENLRKLAESTIAKAEKEAGVKNPIKFPTLPPLHIKNALGSFLQMIKFGKMLRILGYTAIIAIIILIGVFGPRYVTVLASR